MEHSADANGINQLFSTHVRKHFRTHTCHYCPVFPSDGITKPSQKSPMFDTTVIITQFFDDTH
jgi:hypothetical protein